MEQTFLQEETRPRPKLYLYTPLTLPVHLKPTFLSSKAIPRESKIMFILKNVLKNQLKRILSYDDLVDFTQTSE